MKKSIILIVSILLIIMTVGSVFCTPPWGDPSKGRWFDENGNEFANEQEFINSITQDLLRDNPGTALQSQPTAPAAQPSTPAPATATSGNSGKKQAAPKITVYFTDLYGHVVGSNQVTSGTNIAESQFPEAVEDVDGHTFDKWNYDGQALYHDFIVRAEYK